MGTGCGRTPTVFDRRDLILNSCARLQGRGNQPFHIGMNSGSRIVIGCSRALLGSVLSRLSRLKTVSRLRLLRSLHLLTRKQRVSCTRVIPLLDHFGSDYSKVIGRVLCRITGDLGGFIRPTTGARHRLRRLFSRLDIGRIRQLN